MNNLLTGIRVLDLTRLIAGPYAAQTLGDMGAEVIKLERPVTGDESRQYGPPFLNRVAEASASETSMFLACNRNKKGIAVDIASAAGQQLVRELAALSDILIENFKADDLAKYGLGYDQLRVLNPRLIYCSITGFGQTGPYRRKPATDSVFQAMSGMMSLSGEPDGPPMRTGFAAGDIIASGAAVSAILAALYHRDLHQGGGQHIDVSCLDAVVASLSHRVMNYFITGEPPPRMGDATPNTVPSQTFQCSDIPLTVAAGTDRLYQQFCKGIERPDLASDPRFADRVGRAQHREELISELERVMKTRTGQEWMARFDSVGVISAPIYDLKNVFEDPQIISRGLRIEIPHDGIRSLSFIRNPVRYSETDIEEYSLPPMIGEHTDEVLGTLLQKTPEEIFALRSAGVVA